MTPAATWLRRFRAEEDGNATLEFCLYSTLIFTILFAAIELGYINLRHAMLERGVDIAVRDIRLSTGEVPSYDQLRSRICEATAIAGDCEANLQLELAEVDPRAFVPLAAAADCVNAEQEPRPARTFRPGLDNDLMLIRACLKFRPIFPTTRLGIAMRPDAQGYAQMVATAAFVQEPR